MQWWTLLHEFATFRYAFAAGLIVAVVCSVLSVFVVLRRMAFVGQGISHAGFGGIGLATLLGLTAPVPQMAMVLAFCIGSGFLIAMLSRKQRIEADTAIGILLVAAMAVGVLATDLSVTLGEYAWYQQWVGQATARPSFEKLLFGSMLTTGPTQLTIIAITAIVVLAILALVRRPITFACFDPTSANVFGVRTTLMHHLLLVLLSLTVVICIHVVGFLLVSAMLVIPAATALMLSQRLVRVMIISVAVGVLGTSGGLILALEHGRLSSGASIAIALCAIFSLVYLRDRVLKRGT